MTDSRLRDVPRMRWGDTLISAERYNRIRLGLLRLRNPLRIEACLRDIDVILEDKVWYSVDCSMNELPIVAWDNFQRRVSLHEPIRCRVSYYHAHADKIIDTLFEAIDAFLEKKLLQHRNPG
ncbi:MAG: hypothetical protein SVR94_01200 [Pseudomonadota bacterium]|nr:hypothetical protein [Pseudomonadota bacterium]